MGIDAFACQPSIWYPLNEAKQEFWQQIKDSCNKVGASIDVNNLDVHSLSLSLEPLKGWLGTFQALSFPKQQALMEEQNPDLQAGRYIDKRS